MLGVWEPLTVDEVASLFEGFDAPWWIAGGLAVEAFLGRSIRSHGDIDVGVLRRDQLLVQRQLAGWDLQAADPPGKLRPWLEGETLPDSVHVVWCRASADAAWGLELMLEDAEGDEWEYRRMPSVHRPVDSLTWQLDRIPYIAVEIQLLYTARAQSPKHIQDFEACLPQLSPAQKRWLASALALAHPGHDWIERLAGANNIDAGS